MTVDDVAFVSLVIDYLAASPNVDASHVQLIGNSNGAALINRILIESADARSERRGIHPPPAIRPSLPS